MARSEKQTDVARFFIELALANKHKNGISDQRRKKLFSLLRALTIVESGTLSDLKLTYDPDYNGYVKASLTDLDVYIPFHLVRFFPNRTLLEEIVKVSESVRVNSHSAICISGSATFLGASKSLSDLDFCEYVGHPVSEFFQLVFGSTSQQQDGLVLVIIKADSKNYIYPWPDSERFWDDARAFESFSAKIDWIYLSKNLGPIPVTNVALSIDPTRPDEGGAVRSHAYQEAVLIKQGGPPRALVRAESLGEYINFLRHQVYEYRSSDPLKALKRAFCFFRLVSIHEPADAISKVLLGNAAELFALARRQSEIEGLLQLVPPQLHQAIAPTIDSVRLPPDMVAYAEGLVMPWMRALAEEMLHRIDVLYDGATLPEVT